MAPPSSAHVQLGDVPRTHNPVELRGRVPSARRRDDDVDEATDIGLRLSTATILPRWNMVEGGAPHTAGRDLCDQLVCLEVPPCPRI